MNENEFSGVFSM